MSAKNKIEAALFMSSKPLSFTELHEIAKTNVSELREALNELISEYSERDSALEIKESSLGYQLKVKKEYEGSVSRYAQKSEFGRSMLKTLALIAYKQPIKQSEVIKYRTNSAYNDVKELEEKGFISRQPEGRSYIVRTTKKFTEYFGEDPVRLEEKQT